MRPNSTHAWSLVVCCFLLGYLNYYKSSSPSSKLSRREYPSPSDIEVTPHKIETITIQKSENIKPVEQKSNQKLNKTYKKTSNRSEKSFDLNKNTTLDVDCNDIKFAPPGYFLPAVPLLSIPGAGNTWVRFLIQKITGYYTGSIYSDVLLRLGGFPGEVYPILGGRVLTIKAHQHVTNSSKDLFDQAEKCIYLIRNPKDAAIAEIKRQQSVLFDGRALHSSDVDMDKVLEIRGEKMMKKIYIGKMKTFRNIYRQWNDQCSNIHTIFYEQLKNDTFSEMEKLLEFLELDKKRLRCLHRGTEGDFYRKKNATNNAWVDKLLNTDDRLLLDGQLNLLNAWIEAENLAREGAFFKLPSNYRFY